MKRGRLRRSAEAAGESDDSDGDLVVLDPLDPLGAAGAAPRTPSKRQRAEATSQPSVLEDSDDEAPTGPAAGLGSPRTPDRTPVALLSRQLRAAIAAEDTERVVSLLRGAGGRKRRARVLRRKFAVRDDFGGEEEESSSIAQTPLMYAVRVGNAALFLAMLRCVGAEALPEASVAALEDGGGEGGEAAAGAKWDPRDELFAPPDCADSGCSLMHLACELDHVAIVDILLRACSEDAAWATDSYMTAGRCSDSVTPLMAAAGCGSHRCVRRLAGLLGDRVGSGDRYGIPYVKGAPRKRPLLCARDKAGATALHYAAGNGSILCVHWILCGATEPALCAAPQLAHAGAEDGARLGNAGAAPGSAGGEEEEGGEGSDEQEGDDASFPAVPEAHEGALDALAKAVLTMRDESGATALHIAAGEGNATVVRQLIRWGADVLGVDSKTWVPLLYANVCGKPKCVLTLLEFEGEAQLISVGKLLQRGPGSRQAALRLIRQLASSAKCHAFLNALLRRHPSLVDGALAFLADLPGLLDLPNKRRLMRCRLDALLAAQHATPPLGSPLGWRRAAVATVPRGRAWSGFQAHLRRTPSATIVDVLRRGFRMQFEGEPGVGPGVDREALEGVAAELGAGRGGLFEAAPDGESLMPARFVGKERRERRERWTRVMHSFEDLGLLVGHCQLHAKRLPLPLSAPFCKAVLHRPFSLADLESVDPQLSKSLNYILDADDVRSLDLSFVTMDGVELLRGGRDKPVTRENRKDYVAQYAEHFLTALLGEPAAALRRGLAAVADWKGTFDIFNETELSLVLHGCEKVIDDEAVDEWRATASYNGYEDGRMDLHAAGDSSVLHRRADDGASPQVKWFWKVVRDSDASTRSLLLKFCTGAAGPPVGGFRALTLHSRGGNIGPLPFTINRVEISPTLQRREDLPLPTAATCFNLLKLPSYRSYGELEEKLLTAVRLGSEGFAFS